MTFAAAIGDSGLLVRPKCIFGSLQCSPRPAARGIAAPFPRIARSRPLAPNFGPLGDWALVEVQPCVSILYDAEKQSLGY